MNFTLLGELIVVGIILAAIWAFASIIVAIINKLLKL
jgi:hypothetical protein